jgi:cyclopropane-fatty-acyl-phospholipid synthase
MIGDIEVSSLKGAINVRHRIHRPNLFLFHERVSQLWLDNQAGMEFTLSSTVARLSSAISSLYNCFLGQSPSQARLNVIASYDQSNELFKV